MSESQPKPVVIEDDVKTSDKGTTGHSSARNTQDITESATKILQDNGYRLGKSIGEGSYAKVRLVYNNKNEKFAVKIVSRNKAPADFVAKFFPRELEIITNLNHENVVKVHKILEIGDKVYIIMELADHGDLLDYVKKNGAIPEPRAKVLFYQLVKAVQYCHSKEVTHRDLKCENVLLDKNDRIKVSDFGFARYCVDNNGKRILSKTYCGSAAYAAPEVLQGIPYNPKMYDVWSLGCILYIIVCGSMPYDDSNVKKMLKNQLEKKVGFPSRVNDKLSQECKSLIHHMLEVDITKRATIDQVLKSEWLKPMSHHMSVPGDHHHSAGSSAKA